MPWPEKDCSYIEIGPWISGSHLRLDGLVKERHNSIANALELRLFCTNLSICIPEAPAKFQNEMSFSIEVWELAR